MFNRFETPAVPPGLNHSGTKQNCRLRCPRVMTGLTHATSIKDPLLGVKFAEKWHVYETRSHTIVSQKIYMLNRH